MKQPKPDLLTCLHDVKAIMDAVPVSDFHAAKSQLAEQILAKYPTAKFNDRWDGCRISLAGVQASSTMGLKAALRNWVQAAYRALDRKAAAGLERLTREGGR